MVDTDGKPDTPLPKSSNFVTGVAPAATAVISPAPCIICKDATSCPPGYCPHQAYHCNPNVLTWDPYDEGVSCRYLHCLWVCVRCVVQVDPVGTTGSPE